MDNIYLIGQTAEDVDAQVKTKYVFDFIFVNMYIGHLF
jgi:hypothetical protein